MFVLYKAIFKKSIVKFKYGKKGNIGGVRPCVVVTCYNASTMGHYPTRGNPVSMGHHSIKWCSGDNAPFNP
ncbi:hypothetical protein Hanom_Chr10g00902191 [Helianthus anomalus]